MKDGDGDEAAVVLALALGLAAPRRAAAEDLAAARRAARRARTWGFPSVWAKSSARRRRGKLCNAGSPQAAVGQLLGSHQCSRQSVVRPAEPPSGPC